jgi:Big-like domain-containing protein/PKD domain-containing protein
MSLSVGFAAAACQRVPLLAPSGSSITLTASSNAVPVNGSVQLIAQILEAAGTPPHSGTHVIFTTTLGTIEPSEVETDVSGRAVATFKAGVANGMATITASSGGASASGNNAVKIAVGTAAVGRVTVSANPTLVPAQGGTSVVTAVVIDINGNALPSAPVAFSTTAGALDAAFANTDSGGVATTRLTTSTQATVTASVGAQAPAGGSTGGGTGTGGTGGGTGTPTSSGQASGSVTIGVAAAPTLIITPPSNPPIAGLPATFTFAVTVPTTNGSAVRDVVVDWGDGFVQDLGAVTGNDVVAHTYRAPGTYSITATVTDASGNSVVVRSAVIVNAASLPITITPPSTPPGVGLPAAFTIVIGALPPGDVVRNVHLDWGDGSAQDLGAISGSTAVSHVFQTAGSFIVTATLSDTVGNSSTVSTAVTVVATASPTIIITPTNVPTVHAATMNVTFQIQVTAPAGVGIQDAAIDFGDNQTADLGGLNGTVTVQHPYTSAGSFTVKLNVKDTLGRTTTGTTSITLP